MQIVTIRELNATVRRSRGLSEPSAATTKEIQPVSSVQIIASAMVCLFLGSQCARADAFSSCADANAGDALSASTCLVVELPLVPDKDNAGTVDLFVRQFPAADPDRRRGQVWLVAGGPGEAGASLYPLIPVFQRAFPDFDLIVPDHRGTGGSTRLCPEQEAAGSPAGYALGDEEWGPCIGALHADAERNRAFTVTHAAHDLSSLVSRLRKPGEVHVYGVSYGTQLVLRMMQVAPPELDGLVLDGLVPPESEQKWDLSHRTAVVDEVGRSGLTRNQTKHYVRLLATEPAPWKAALPGVDLRQFMGSLLNFPTLRGRIPAIVSSLQKGDADVLEGTVADLQKEFARLAPYPQSSPSLPLVMLISASENNGRRGLTADTVKEEAAQALFTSALPGLLVNTPVPLYERDKYFGQVPARIPRTLVIHGTRDPNTPYHGARAHAAALASAGQVQFSTITGGAHLLPFAAPACFGEVVSAFMSGETAPASCQSP